MRLSLPKRLRQLILLAIINMLAFLITLSSLQSWFIAVAVIVVATSTLINRSITTKKNNLRVLRTLRPLLITLSTAVLISNGTGVLEISFGWILIISFTLASLLSLLVYYELSNQVNKRIEHSLNLIATVLISQVYFIAIAVWGLPVWVCLFVAWLLFYIIANFWLYTMVEKPESLALIWALLATQICLISSFWINFYSLPLIKIYIAQASIIIGALAYGLGGIYYHYRNKTLSRNLLFEYIIVTILIFGILIAMTKWVFTI